MRVNHTEVEIHTADGTCPTHVLVPDGTEPRPAVIVYMDGIGMRPAIVEIAERIAQAGYFVLAPNLFYRVPFDGSLGPRIFTEPAARADLMTRVMPSASAGNVMRDTETLFEFLSAQPMARTDRVATTGYCLGGRLSLYAAGYFGERLRAAASYHGGGLATDAPDSPHLLAPQMKARVYVGGAKDDKGFDEAQKARLEHALTGAHVVHTIETYDAHHGWVPRDTPAHDERAAARHWETLFHLLDETLSS